MNGPWKERQKEDLQRVLRAIGTFPEDDIESVAKAIYTSGVFSNNAYHFTLACFGEVANPDISRDFPDVPQILWNNVLAFIYGRFRKYRDQKASHGQWDEVGKDLWDCVWQNRSLETFRAAVRIQGG